MFLKNLTLKGFKSFADTTKLELTSGITVVVGPNGSGKSNVVDAIAWVLGAQAPKAVRSGKMDDVIFAGTAKRSALGRAEVSLTIDNSDGALPIDFTEVTLTRVLFRTGDSEYAINGVAARLLDIQDLLSDSGVGRQQHVIISQGQIDAVLNARPEERRYIIEEAAGILKYRRRKERAERRLLGTEANLVRLQDLLREIRRQLRPLERQADAARRHGEVSSALREVRVFLIGRDLARAQARLGESNAALVKLQEQQSEIQASLGKLDAAVVAEESLLDAQGVHDLSDDLVVFEALAARAKAIRLVIEERQRYAERAVGLEVSSSPLDDLLSQHTATVAELERAETELAGVALVEAQLADQEKVLQDQRPDTSANRPSALPHNGPELGEVRGELSAISTSTAHTEVELEQLDNEIARLNQTLADDTSSKAELEGAIEAAVTQESTAQIAAATALQQFEAVTERNRKADQLRQERNENAARWIARAEALSQALDEARSKAGAQTLSQVDGVVGTLLDVVIIEEGWQAACEAALGDALLAVVVEGIKPGRDSLSMLAQDDKSVAVLPLGLFEKAGSSAISEQIAEGLTLGGDTEWILKYVHSESESVQQLLNHLLARALVVEGSWREALDVALEQPECVVVTKEGDRFSPTGWRLGGGGAGATGAAHAEALAQAAQAQAEADRATKAYEELQTQQREAEADHKRAVAMLENARSELARLRRGVEAVESNFRTTSARLDSLHQRRVERGERFTTELARQEELEALLPGLEAEFESRRNEARRLATERASYDEKVNQLGNRRRSIELKKVELNQQVGHLNARIQDLNSRIKHERNRAAKAHEQRQRARVRLDALKQLHDAVVQQESRVHARLEALSSERHQRSEEARQAFLRLEALRAERSATEGQLQELRERHNRESLVVSEAQMRLETLSQSVRSELDMEPSEAMAQQLPEIPDGQSPEEWRRYLEREIRLMGPINPLALSEYEALAERHDFLTAQLEDVRSTRRDLSKIIRTIDAEIVDIFADAYHDVARNFAELFTTLFPGGKGGLSLSDANDLLTSGVEVEARPSGKNVAKLSLLSGGERSLTALAFLFAVFRSRPSPFYVMDEVEAALDDVNLHRFLQLVHEFRSDAQLLIVSHQKRTMEIADCLYGVTMQPGGSSKVVSEQMA